MENRRDDEEVELMTIGAGATVDKDSAPPSKKRRLSRVVDKGGSSSSPLVSTRSLLRSAARIVAAETEV